MYIEGYIPKHRRNKIRILISTLKAPRCTMHFPWWMDMHCVCRAVVIFWWVLSINHYISPQPQGIMQYPAKIKTPDIMTKEIKNEIIQPLHLPNNFSVSQWRDLLYNRYNKFFSFCLWKVWSVPMKWLYVDFYCAHMLSIAALQLPTVFWTLMTIFYLRHVPTLLPPYHIEMHMCIHIYKRAPTWNPKHLLKSILQLQHQMHMQSLCSELSKECIPINLGIYYSHKEILGYE
jgi:hypothetical protein